MKNEVTTQVKRNLYQKLHYIQETVLGVGKDKKAFNYSYTTGDKILKEIKPLMNSLGLLLVPNAIDVDVTRQDYSSAKGVKSENTFVLKMVFTWIDVESGDKLEVPFYGAGQNDWDKGLYSSYTSSERYFLLKFFHISTDADDIDNPAIKREIESRLAVAKDNEELMELWQRLDSEAQSRNKKVFADRKKEIAQQERLKAVQDEIQSKSK